VANKLSEVQDTSKELFCVCYCYSKSYFGTANPINHNTKVHNLETLRHSSAASSTMNFDEQQGGHSNSFTDNVTDDTDKTVEEGGKKGKKRRRFTNEEDNKIMEVIIK
jgi:hypothetical protein